MALNYPFIRHKREVSPDRSSDVPPTIYYLNKGEDINQHKHFIAFDASGNEASAHAEFRDITFDSNVPGDYSVTLGFDNDGGAYTRTLNVTVLKEKNPKPALGRHDGFFPNFWIDGMGPWYDSGTDSIIYKVTKHVAATNYSLSTLVLGSDGEDAKSDIVITGDAVDMTTVGTYNVNYGLSNDTYNLDVVVDVVPSNYTIPHSFMGVVIQQERHTSDDTYKVYYPSGHPLPLPVGRMDNAGPLTGGVTITELSNDDPISPDKFRYKTYGLMKDGENIPGTFKDYVFVEVDVPDEYPSITIYKEFEVDGVANYCMEVDGAGGIVPFAFDADGVEQFFFGLTFDPPPQDINFHAPGAKEVDITIPAANGNPAFTKHYVFNIGMDACCAARVAAASESGGNGNTFNPCSDNGPADTVPDNVDYFGQYDWPTPHFRVCPPQDLGNEPGVDVPYNIRWLAVYEANFHKDAMISVNLIDSNKTIRKWQSYFMQVVRSILVNSGNNNAKFTDLLNRINTTPRVYGGVLIHRGMEDLTPEVFPEWWDKFLTILITAADPDERTNINSSVDFPTVLEGAPSDTIDFLQQYFAGL